MLSYASSASVAVIIELFLPIHSIQMLPYAASASLAVLIGLTLCLIVAVRRYSRTKSSTRKASPTHQSIHPSGPAGLPIFGNLFDLGKEPHRTLTELGSVYGSVFRLQLGCWPAIIVNGAAAVKEAFLKTGDILASRPDFQSYRIYSEGKSISFHPFNPALKQQRKTTSHVIGRLMHDGIAEELVDREVEELLHNWLDPSHVEKNTHGFDPASDLTLAVASFLYSFCYGKEHRLTENEDFRRLILEANPGTELFATGSNIDLLPWPFRLVSYFKHRDHRKRMQQFVRLNNSHKHQNETSPTCVIGAMIDASRDLLHNSTSGLSEDHLLNVPVEFMSAGTETSTATLLWILRFMATHDEIQKRVHHELDSVLDPDDDRLIPHSIRNRLPYTESCILESMRLVTVVPFGLPHFSSESSVVDGYSIPRNTLVLANLWSVGRDPTFWDEPDKFMPERFLTVAGNDVSVDRKKAESFYPFGIGKRRCVGEPIGRLLSFVIFVNVMKLFDVKLIDDDLEQKTGSVQGPEVYGDVMRPAPYRITIRNRVSGVTNEPLSAEKQVQGQ